MLKRIGCTPDQIKECLIALMYGAHQLDWDRAAIPSILRSRVTTTRFRHDPWVTALRSECGRGVMRFCWVGLARNRGSLVNEAGKSISPDHKPSQILAHILQGAEAAVLRVAP
jgi:hypothetical protein